MADTNQIGLDNTAFSGRLRSSAFTSEELAQEEALKAHRRSQVQPDLNTDLKLATPHIPISHSRPQPVEQTHVPVLHQPVPRSAPEQVHRMPPQPVYEHPVVEPAVVAAPAPHVVAPQPFAEPAEHKLQKSTVMNRSSVTRPVRKGFGKAHRAWTPIQMSMVGIAAAVFAIGVLVSLNTIKTNNETQAQLATLTKDAVKSQKVQVPAVLGSSTVARPVNNYIPAPDQPKLLKVPKMRLNGTIEPVGMSSNNVLGAPTDIRNVGWYMSSGKPGDPAAVMVMNGFVGTANHPGAFNKISKLAVNDLFQVVTGDDRPISYRVVQVVNFDPSRPDIASLLTPIKQGIATVDLITVGSTVNGNDNSQGTIVYAVQQI